MQNPEALQLPFLVRDMLKFEGAAAFDLEITVGHTRAASFEVVGLTREGPFNFRIAVTSTAGIDTFTRPIPDVPISVTTIVRGEDSFTNEELVSIHLRANETRVMLLCQGYISSVGSISWPAQPQLIPLQRSGKYHTISGANPAANAEWSITIPATQWWLVRAIRATLVTDANAANRRVALSIDDNGGLVQLIGSAATQVASQTTIYNWAPGNVVIDDQVGLRQYAPLPNGLLLPAGTVISSVTTNRQAGDDWGAPLLTGEVLFGHPPAFV